MSILHKLMLFSQATSCCKQKDSLQKELESFLGSLPEHPSLSSVTPWDICHFLVLEDRNERAQVHGNGCNFFGQKGIHQRGCSLRLSYKTVDSSDCIIIGIIKSFLSCNSIMHR